MKTITLDHLNTLFEVLDALLYETLDKNDYKEAEQLISKLTEIIKVALDSVKTDFNNQARKQGVRI